MEKKLQYRVTAEDVPCKVEFLLKKRMGLTKHQISSAKFCSGGICLNGKQARVNAQAAAGDILEAVLEQKDSASKLERAPGMLDILYEDEDLIIINKPAGMAVHPGHGHYRDTLANHLLFYLEEKGEPAVIRAAGRLDKDTSGIVVFAKNKVASSRLNAGGVKKTYLALVQGQLGEAQGQIELPIRKCEDALNRMEASEQGCWSRTHYRVLKEYETCTLTELWLDTGRTHQIRVHMAAVGHPLLGDPIYGGEQGKGPGWEAGTKKGSDGMCGGKQAGSAARAGGEMNRAALHCWRAELAQPFTGEKIRCCAELPEDMRKYIGEIRAADKRRYGCGI